MTTATTPSIPMLRCTPWAARPQVAPQLTGSPETVLRVESNGSRGCFGGWEVFYPAGEAGAWYLFRVKARWKGLQHGFASLSAEGKWVGTSRWEPMIDYESDGAWVELRALVQNPGGAQEFSVKLLLRWSPTGVVEWRAPELLPATAPPPRPIRLGAASFPPKPAPQSLQENVERFSGICRQAAAQGIQLLCLPEVILSYGIPERAQNDPYTYAVTVPGPFIDPFCALATETRMAICFSVLEKEEELLHNTAVLIDENGAIAAKYRKVHLAPPLEAWRGTTPGDSFPVGAIQTAQARVGMNICMDSSAEESARCTARAGAEIVLLPIMGDHRATLHWAPVPHVFDLRRWCMIHQVRARDNQIYLVAARNQGVGTGIFAPDGTTLALDEGATPIVHADVDLAALPRVETTFKAKCWYERREMTYGNIAGALLPKIDENW